MRYYTSSKDFTRSLLFLQRTALSYDSPTASLLFPFHSFVIKERSSRARNRSLPCCKLLVVAVHSIPLACYTSLLIYRRNSIGGKARICKSQLQPSTVVKLTLATIDLFQE